MRGRVCGGWVRGGDTPGAGAEGRVRGDGYVGMATRGWAQTNAVLKAKEPPASGALGPPQSARRCRSSVRRRRWAINRHRLSANFSRLTVNRRRLSDGLPTPPPIQLGRP